MPASLIHIPQSSPVSGRVRDYLSEFNRAAADPTLGASLEQIKKGIKEFTARPANVVDDTDLVGRLKNDNKALWGNLLNNTFCMKMKTAASDDQQVLEGFKWYMRQDFLYCVKLITYEATRAPKALTSADFATSMQRVKDNSDYASDILQTCTDQPPNGLGIGDSIVLGTPETRALQEYTDYQISIANTTNWVLSLVAMIPCIQSYYEIAVDLNDNSIHTDTPWYKLWAVPNASSDAYAYTVAQQKFFADNYDQWKDNYSDANTIFQRACNGEIDLWGTALNPGTR